MVRNALSGGQGRHHVASLRGGLSVTEKVTVVLQRELHELADAFLLLLNLLLQINNSFHASLWLSRLLRRFRRLLLIRILIRSGLILDVESSTWGDSGHLLCIQLF